MSDITGVNSIAAQSSPFSTSSNGFGISSGSNSSSSNSSSSTSGTSKTATTTGASKAQVLINNAQFASSGATGALLAGNSSGLTPTVLGDSENGEESSLFGSLPSTNSTILNQIENEANARFTKLQQAITDQADAEQSAITAQQNNWITVQASVDGANASVTTGQKAITQVQDLLLDIRGAVSLAGQQGQDVNYEATQFDDTINKIEFQANSDGSQSLTGNINPITNAPNQVQYSNAPDGNLTTLNGTYIGTSYVIYANDGSVWVPDVTSDTLAHYSSFDGEQETTNVDGLTMPDQTSTTNGVQLLSYDPTTNAISISVTIDPSQPARVVTGTLQRTGNGLMQSWFYDGLSTADGRQRAYDDINQAVSNVTSSSATLQAAANQVSIDSNNAKQQLGNLSDESTQVKQTELTKEQALETQSEQQLSALQTNLQDLQNTQSNYLDMLSSDVDDPLGQSLLDMTV